MKTVAYCLFALVLCLQGCGLASSRLTKKVSTDLPMAAPETLGLLDTTFGDSGKLSLFSFSGYPSINSQGQLQSLSQNAASDIQLHRYLWDGSSDNSFGIAGTATVDFGGLNDTPNGSLTLGDGKTLIIGTSSQTGVVGSSIVIARLTQNGSLDPSFGQDGKTIIPSGGKCDTARAVVTQPDGKAVIAGYRFSCGNNNADYRGILTRLTANGQLDVSFGNAGVVEVLIPSRACDQFQGMALQPDGRIVTTGISMVNTHRKLSVFRFSKEGTLDSTFQGGSVLVSFNRTDSQGGTIAIQKDGKILLGGTSYDGPNIYTASNSDMSVARLLPDGSLDSRFGSGGFTVIDFGGVEMVRNLLLQPNGKIFLSGESAGTSGVSEGHIATARLQSDGTLDSHFGQGGRAEFGFSGWDRASGSAFLQADGAIVLGGADITPGKPGFFAIRIR